MAIEIKLPQVKQRGDWIIKYTWKRIKAYRKNINNFLKIKLESQAKD